KDCYKKPKSSSICSDTQSKESEDDNITVDPGWDDFCLTSAKLPRMEAHRLGKKTRTREKGKENRRSSAPNRALGKRSLEVLNYMSLVIAKSNPDYIEAKQATEEIETPSIGFAAPFEFKEGTIKTLGAVIKQNNTILYLLVKQGEEVKSIREDLIEVKGRLKKLEKQEATPPQEFGEAIADLTKRLEKIGKKMSQRRVPTLFSVREGTSTDDLPTQDDQVRNYQWTQRRRFELQRGIRRLRGQRYNNTLESMVNPEQQLAISGRRRAQLAPSEILYSYHRQTARHRVYEHYSEQRINCGEGDQVDLRLWRLSNTSYVGFNYNIENVVDHLSTRGISAIPEERKTMEELEGQSWHLRPFENETVKAPTGMAVHQRINRTTSLRFERYRNQTPSRASVDQRDQEVMEDDEETL
ncbi:hypothetical protein Tco_0378009, partial [Tanacetum coccineum]